MRSNPYSIRLRQSEPTDEQIEERVTEKVDDLVTEALKEYAESGLESDLAPLISGLLRFDLPPQEMAALQARKILLLSSFVVIRRERTLYYRDRADFSKADNLMSLPRYTPVGD